MRLFNVRKARCRPRRHWSLPQFIAEPSIGRDERAGEAGREVAASTTEPETWFDTSIEERERAQLIQSALVKLTDIHREVITLKVWGGLTFAEIAAALGIPANTAASRYRYALHELRKQMVGCYERV